MQEEKMNKYVPIDLSNLGIRIFGRNILKRDFKTGESKGGLYELIGSLQNPEIVYSTFDGAMLDPVGGETRELVVRGIDGKTAVEHLRKHYEGICNREDVDPEHRSFDNVPLKVRAKKLLGKVHIEMQNQLSGNYQVFTGEGYLTEINGKLKKN